MVSCWKCDAAIGESRKVGREELCEGCSTWIHCCNNCRFWNESGRSCDEAAAEWVHDRERGNFCDFFSLPAPDDRIEGGSEQGGSGPDSGRSAFDALFK